MDTKTDLPSLPATRAGAADVRAPELRSIDGFGNRALASLIALPSDQRAHAYVQANTYVWPDAVKDLKPDGWDKLDDREKFAHPDGKELWRVLNTVTSEFERSRQWWREELKRTDAEHLAWWSGHSSPNTKMSHDGA